MSDNSFEDFKKRMAGVNAPATQEDDDLGPCASRPGNKWVTCLHVHDGPKPVESLQYQFLAVRSEFTPTAFWFIFAGDEKWKLTVQGRNLWVIYNYIATARLEWIRKADRDFGGDEKKPVITAIKLENITPED